MWQLSSSQREALVALDRFLENEQGSIDTILVLARFGFGESPFSHLIELYGGPLAVWQIEEFSEVLAELLATVERMIEEEYEDDWEADTIARYQALLSACRDVETELESAVEAH